MEDLLMLIGVGEPVALWKDLCVGSQHSFTSFKDLRNLRKTSRFW